MRCTGTKPTKILPKPTKSKQTPGVRPQPSKIKVIPARVAVKTTANPTIQHDTNKRKHSMSPNHNIQKEKISKTEKVGFEDENRFAVLSENGTKHTDAKTNKSADLNDSRTFSDDESTMSDTSNKKPKVPPIVVTHEVVQYKSFCEAIRKGCKEDVFFKYTPKATTIYTTTTEDSENIQAGLKRQKLAFFTYTYKKNKIYHRVIKGLPTIPTEDILAELEELGAGAVRCCHLKQKRIKQPPFTYPIYMVSFATAELAVKASEIKYLAYCKIKWDKYKNKKQITQCHRCQQFGHGSNNCNQAAKCVKCPGNHLTADCIKMKEDPPTCVNCSGQHPANYKQCPMYLQHLEKLHKNKKPSTKAEPTRQRRAQQQTDDRRQPTSSTPLHHQQDGDERSRKTYARVTRSDEPISDGHQVDHTPTQIINDITTLLEIKNEMNKLKDICDLNKMLEIITKLNNKLTKCSSEQEKFIIFYEHFTQNG